MHSRDPEKPQDEFDREFRAILDGTLAIHRPKDFLDFNAFVFVRLYLPKSFTFTKGVCFREATFLNGLDLSWATFSENADFRSAKFKDANFHIAMFSKGANFDNARFEYGDFGGARFDVHVSFMMAEFTNGANFSAVQFPEVVHFEEVVFGDSADFRGAVFGGAAFFDDVKFGTLGPLVHPVADFRNVALVDPELVRFVRVNQWMEPRFLARFLNCRIEKVMFDAVNWCRYKGRMVLQDELDLLERHQGGSSYEEVAIAYRRLITNYEKARAYDLVEDCTIGEFEMKRKNPDRFLFAEWMKPVYESFPFLRRWIGEQVSIVGIYRLVSLHGTNYQRALFVLGLLLLMFGLGYSGIGDLCHRAISIGNLACEQGNPIDVLVSGLLHSLEIATFEPTPLYQQASFRGRLLEVLERILVAGQLALFLFALRRRFRR